jgi:hypothetical protein
MYGQVSAAPTLPGGVHTTGSADEFDVAALYGGPLGTPATTDSLPLDEKLRQAYFWIVNHAIISPHYAMEFADGPQASATLGAGGRR